MTHQITSAQGSLFWEEDGAGPPLVLLHAFPLDARMWAEEAGRLAGRYRVLRPYWRGCDLQTRAEDSIPNVQDLAHNQPVTPADLAEDVALILQAALAAPAIAVGCSLGGYVLYNFMRRHAELVRALVICDGRPQADPDGGAARRQADQVLLEQIRAQGLAAARAAWCERMLARILGPYSQRQRPELLARLRGWISQRSLAAVLRLNQGMALREDGSAVLAEISVPTLLLAGAEDALWPENEMRAVAAAVAGAQAAVIPQAGHLAPIENPEAFHDVLDRFLLESEFK